MPKEIYCKKLAHTLSVMEADKAKIYRGAHQARALGGLLSSSSPTLKAVRWRISLAHNLFLLLGPSTDWIRLATWCG